MFSSPDRLKKFPGPLMALVTSRKEWLPFNRLTLDSWIPPEMKLTGALKQAYVELRADKVTRWSLLRNEEELPDSTGAMKLTNTTNVFFFCNETAIRDLLDIQQFFQFSNYRPGNPDCIITGPVLEWRVGSDGDIYVQVLLSAERHQQLEDFLDVSQLSALSQSTNDLKDPVVYKEACPRYCWADNRRLVHRGEKTVWVKLPISSFEPRLLDRDFLKQVLKKNWAVKLFENLRDNHSKYYADFMRHMEETEQTAFVNDLLLKYIEGSVLPMSQNCLKLPSEESSSEHSGVFTKVAALYLLYSG